jgi:hypothetical protein
MTNMNSPGNAHDLDRRLRAVERSIALWRPPVYTVATAPSAAQATAGAMIYVSDGAAGLPIAAFSDGTNWLRCDTRAVTSAS